MARTLLCASALSALMLLSSPADARHRRRFHARDVASTSSCNEEQVLEAIAIANSKCCPADTNGAYVSCAAHVANDLIKQDSLQPSCKQRVLQAGCQAATTTTTSPPSTTTTEAPPTTTTTEAPPTTTTTQAP